MVESIGLSDEEDLGEEGAAGGDEEGAAERRRRRQRGARGGRQARIASPGEGRGNREDETSGSEEGETDEASSNKLSRNGD